MCDGLGRDECSSADDDWKGEDLIKRRPTRAEQYSRGMSAIKTAEAKRRLADGTNPGRIGASAWARSIHYDAVAARKAAEK